MRTIASAWAVFEENVLPPTCGEVQRTEMRRAFYAGFWSSLCLANEIAGDGISETAAVHMLQGLHEESHRFAAEVAAGRA